MRKLLDGLYDGAAWLAALFMIGVLAMVLLSIVSRQFGFHVAGTDAYAGYAIAAALFLALPSTLLRGEHIRVTLLLERLPAGWRAAFEWWSLAAGAALAIYLAWFSVRLVWVSYSTHDISPAADATPLWIPQLAMALGCIGFAAGFLQAIVARRGGRDIVAPAAAAHTE